MAERAASAAGVDSTVVASLAAAEASPVATVDSRVEATSAAVVVDSMAAVADSMAAAAADSTVAVGTANPQFSTSESPSASADGLLFSVANPSSNWGGLQFLDCEIATNRSAMRSAAPR